MSCTGKRMRRMDKALIVKEKWLNLILDGNEEGQKLWEIRRSRTQVRGRVGLIQSGSGLIVGSTEIVGSAPLLREDFEMFRYMHKIDGSFNDLPYAEPYIWYLKEPQRFSSPIPYKHPQGAVIWVNLKKGMILDGKDERLYS